MKSKLLIVLLVSFLFANRYALLVGNSEGGSGLSSLKYVNADLKEMSKVLRENCQFPENSITLLKNSSPAELREKLHQLKSRMSDEDMLFFYYTGHADSRSLRMGNERFNLDQLKENFDNLPSSMQMIVLDACQSGSFSRLKGGTIDKPLILQQEQNSSGRVVLYSSSDAEFSQESDYLGHSIFSFYFMNGLKGMADQSGDKRVTVDEAYRYAYRQTVSATVHSAGGIQHPGYLFNFSGKGDIVLADQTVQTAGVILDREIQGQVAIIDPSHQVVADFVAEKERDIFVALNPGRYTIYRNHGGKSSKRKIVIKDKIEYATTQGFEKTRSMPVANKGNSSKTEVALCIGAGALFTDHSVLNSSINNSEFFNFIGTTYETGFKDQSLRFAGGIEFLLPRSVFFKLSLARAQYGNESVQFGSVTGPENNLYPTELFHTDKHRITDYSIQVGYQFKKLFFGHLFLSLGGQLSTNRFTSSITYNETLFNSSISTEIEETMRNVHPIISGGYSVPLSSFFKISLNSTYAFKRSMSEQNLLHFASEGLRINLGFSFILN